MSLRRLFNNASDHFYQNRGKYAFLLCLATVAATEAMLIKSDEGVVDVVERPGKTLPSNGISEDCLDYRWYKDLCSLVSGFKYSMSYTMSGGESTLVQNDNSLELVEKGSAPVCMAARFFANRLGEVATAVCNSQKDIGIRLKF